LTFKPGQKLSLILIKKHFVAAAALWAAGKKRLIGQGNTHYKQPKIKRRQQQRANNKTGQRRKFRKNENENKVNTS